MFGEVFNCWHPAPPLTHETKKEGPAFVNPIKTNADYILVASSIHLSHTPAQVDIHHAQFTTFTPFGQLGKNPFDQVIPFPMHIIKGTADEDIDLLPFDLAVIRMHKTTFYQCPV